MTREPVVRCQNAHLVYHSASGSVVALEDFSATIYEGELVCLLGPSGCGKSTLLWAMGGLRWLSSGSILLRGQPVTRPRPEVGMVFQDANLLPWRTLLGNIYFPFEIRRRDPRRYAQKIAHLIEVTGLQGFERRYPHELSGGMQQRASLVRCLAQDPEVILMDEPFGGLDAFTKEEMDVLLLSIWEEGHKTIVFVTHDVHEAVLLADRILVMTPRPGRLAKEFPVALPRPRTADVTITPEYNALVRDVKLTIRYGRDAGGHRAEGL